MVAGFRESAEPPGVDVAGFSDSLPDLTGVAVAICPLRLSTEVTLAVGVVTVAVGAKVAVGLGNDTVWADVGGIVGIAAGDEQPTTAAAATNATPIIEITVLLWRTAIHSFRRLAGIRDGQDRHQDIQEQDAITIVGRYA